MKNRIAKNSFFALMARGSDVIFGIVTLSLATHYLGVAQFGEYAFIRIVSFVVAPFIGLSSLRILIRDISVEKEKSAGPVTSGLVLSNLTAILVLIIITLYIFVFHPVAKANIPALYVAILSQLLWTRTLTISSVFIAHEKMIYDTVITVVTRLLTLLLFFTAIHFRLGIMGLLTASALGYAVGLLWAYLVFAYKFAKPDRSIDIKHLKYLIKESTPVAMSAFLVQGYMYVNVFQLRMFCNNVQGSLFQAPQRAIAPLSLFPRAFLLAFVPTLSRLASNDGSYSELQHAYRKTLKYLFIFTLPICTCGTLYGLKIVSLLFGKDFLEATASFQILLWSIVPLFLNDLHSFILTSTKHQGLDTVANGICLLTNCLLGSILVRTYGHVGASLSFLFSCIILFGVNFYSVSKYLEPAPILHIALRPVFACVAIYFFLSALVNKSNMALLIICAFVIYFTSLFLLKAFTSEEIQAFRRMIRKTLGVPL